MFLLYLTTSFTYFTGSKVGPPSRCQHLNRKFDHVLKLIFFSFTIANLLKSSFESPCNKFWLSQMRLKELNSKFSKTTGLETEADFRVWGHYIFGKAGIRSCNPLVRLSLGCKEGTRRNGRFGLPSRQAPSGNRHQCPFR